MEILTRLLLMNSANDMQNFGAEHVWRKHSHATHRHTLSTLWLRIQLRERDVLKTTGNMSFEMLANQIKLAILIYISVNIEQADKRAMCDSNENDE